MLVDAVTKLAQCARESEKRAAVETLKREELENRVERLNCLVNVLAAVSNLVFLLLILLIKINSIFRCKSGHLFLGYCRQRQQNENRFKNFTKRCKNFSSYFLFLFDLYRVFRLILMRKQKK